MRRQPQRPLVQADVCGHQQARGHERVLGVPSVIRSHSMTMELGSVLREIVLGSEGLLLTARLEAAERDPLGRVTIASVGTEACLAGEGLAFTAGIGAEEGSMPGRRVIAVSMLGAAGPASKGLLLAPGLRAAEGTPVRPRHVRYASVSGEGALGPIGTLALTARLEAGEDGLGIRRKPARFFLFRCPSIISTLLALAVKVRVGGAVGLPLGVGDVFLGSERILEGPDAGVVITEDTQREGGLFERRGEAGTRILTATALVSSGGVPHLADIARVQNAITAPRDHSRRE